MTKPIVRTTAGILLFARLLSGSVAYAVTGESMTGDIEPTTITELTDSTINTVDGDEYSTDSYIDMALKRFDMLFNEAKDDFKSRGLEIPEEQVRDYILSKNISWLTNEMVTLIVGDSPDPAKIHVNYQTVLSIIINYDLKVSREQNSTKGFIKLSKGVHDEKQRAILDAYAERLAQLYACRNDSKKYNELFKQLVIDMYDPMNELSQLEDALNIANIAVTFWFAGTSFGSEKNASLSDDNRNLLKQVIVFSGEKDEEAIANAAITGSTRRFRELLDMACAVYVGTACPYVRTLAPSGE